MNQNKANRQVLTYPTFDKPDTSWQGNPAQSQHYNRYSYVWNNPLKFVDPSGFNPAPFMNENFNYSALPRQGFIGPTSGNHWSDPYRSAEGNFNLMAGLDYISNFGAESYQAQYNAAMGNSTNSTSDYNKEVYAIIAEIYNLGFTVYLPPNTNLLVYGKGDLGEIRKYKDGSYVFMNSTMSSLPFQPDGSSKKPNWDNLSDGERVVSMMNAIRYARLNGNDFIDVHQLFDDFPRITNGGAGIISVASISFGDKELNVHMEIAVYNNMKIGIYNYYPWQAGPFNNYEVKNIIKEGYWDALYLYRHEGNIPLLMFQVDAHYEIFHEYLFGN